MIKQRIEKVREILDKKDLDGILIGTNDNRAYLAEFFGSSGMILITPTQACFATDFRYMEVAKKLESKGYEFIRMDQGLKGVEVLLNRMPKKKNLRLGLENVMSYAYFQEISKLLPEVTLVDIYSDLLEIRSVKDQGELDLLAKAAQIGDIAFSHLLKTIKVGMTELEVAAELEYAMKLNGASYPPFDTIAIFGKKTSMPHGSPGLVKLKEKDIVTLDFGANYQGYCSDMTRTFFVGEPDVQLEKIFNIVFRAQKEAQAFVKAGIEGWEADKVARDIIADEGYGDYFGHSTGHGVGILIHEEPRLSTSSQTILKENMVVTVEPGIYVPELGGVRIENTVVVQKDGSYSLNHSKKDLFTI